MPGDNVEHSAQRPGWLSQLAKRLLLALVLAVVVLACFMGLALVLVTHDHAPPSPRQLAARFPAEQANLEALVRLSDHEPARARVGPKAEHYRERFAQSRISQGLVRDPDSGDIFFIHDSVGLMDSSGSLLNGYSNGYLWCGPNVPHRFRPCSLPGVPEMTHRPTRFGDPAYAFIRLVPDWYAFSDGSANL